MTIFTTTAAKHQWNKMAIIFNTTLTHTYTHNQIDSQDPWGHEKREDDINVVIPVHHWRTWHPQYMRESGIFTKGKTKQAYTHSYTLLKWLTGIGPIADCLPSGGENLRRKRTIRYLHFPLGKPNWESSRDCCKWQDHTVLPGIQRDEWQSSNQQTLIVGGC